MRKGEQRNRKLVKNKLSFISIIIQDVNKIRQKQD